MGANRESRVGDAAPAASLVAPGMVASRLDLAGISTAIVQAGAGRPVVLLHEQGELASRWQRVAAGLVGDHGLIAPDLPGHGGSGLPEGLLDAARVPAW